MSSPMQKEMAKQANEDIKRARIFKDLLNTEGWRLYSELLNDMINTKMMEVIKAPTAEGGVLASEYNKGAVYGIMLARDTPGVNIAAMEQLVAAANEEGKES